MINRPQSYRFHQGDRTLPFAPAEYDARLSDLRELMQVHGVEACVFTSMHNIAYYSGFPILFIWPTLWIGRNGQGKRDHQRRN